MATKKKGRKKANQQAKELIKKLRQRHKKEKARQPRKKKKSSVRHTRAVQRDRSKRQLAPPPDEKITARLTEWVKPTEDEEQGWFVQFGLRMRKLTLSVMVAIVISLIWRQIGAGGSEAARLLQLEGLLWVPTMMVSQQAISERLRTFPAPMFFQLLLNRLPLFQQRSQARQRPLPPALDWAQKRYQVILAVDGSTLDALLRKVGLLRDEENHPLAGKILTVLNVCTLLPHSIWFEPDAKASDQRFWPQMLTAIPAGALLLLDSGFTNFKRFLQLSNPERRITFIIPTKSNLVFVVKRVFAKTPQIHDYLVWIGTGDDRQLVRLVKLYYQGQWYEYLTNELDPHLLPAPYVAALYGHRWRIEDAFNTTKRLLGLAYFWTGSQNGVELQLWATWMVYLVVLDLSDAVAEVLHKPLLAISMEMVFRGLYHFGQAFTKGQADDPVAYLVLHAKLLGIVKRSLPSQTHWLNLTILPEP
ncbi:MAG: IS4 family transposase [Pseudomonadota bacterium]